MVSEAPGYCFCPAGLPDRRGDFNPSGDSDTGATVNSRLFYGRAFWQERFALSLAPGKAAVCKGHGKGIFIKSSVTWRIVLRTGTAAGIVFILSANSVFLY